MPLLTQIPSKSMGSVSLSRSVAWVHVLAVSHLVDEAVVASLAAIEVDEEGLEVEGADSVAAVEVLKPVESLAARPILLCARRTTT